MTELTVSDIIEFVEEFKENDNEWNTSLLDLLFSLEEISERVALTGPYYPNNGLVEMYSSQELENIIRDIQSYRLQSLSQDSKPLKSFVDLSIYPIRMRSSLNSPEELKCWGMIVLSLIFTQGALALSGLLVSQH